MQPLEELIGLLDVESIESNLFRGYHPKGREHRLFGGQILAQALIAAGRTIDPVRQPHSLHAYFLRPGDPKVPALFKVERTRDGRSFTTRNVVVIQRGEAIFSMSCSFQVPEAGLEHQMGMPDRRPPGDDEIDKLPRQDAFISFRCDHRRLSAEEPQAPMQDVWFRTDGRVEGPQLLHTALILYQSDDALLSTCRLPHRGHYTRSKLQGASLDHAMWFHHPARADEWLLYAMDSPSTSNARGFNRGGIYTADGKLVMSTMQEGLMRLRK